MTVLEVIQSATGYLTKNGVDDARLNAEHLLAHALGKKKRLDLYLEFDRPLSDAERAPLRDLVRSRGQGVPLQHLLGTVEFHGRTFKSDARALIPRPETEQLVELAQAAIQNPNSKILDVGTGSGVIAITLALQNPAATVTATDLSPAALALAAENAATHNAPVRFVEADLLPPGDERFHLVVANLPYIPAADLPGLAREVHHDPASALDGGADGLEIIQRLADILRPRLEPDAALWLEIGHDQSDRVCALLTALGYRDVASVRDYPGIERFVRATAPAL